MTSYSIITLIQSIPEAAIRTGTKIIRFISKSKKRKKEVMWLNIFQLGLRTRATYLVKTNSRQRKKSLKKNQ